MRHEPVILDSLGNTFDSMDPSVEHIFIGTSGVVGFHSHGETDSFFERVMVSKEWHVLVCRECCFRFYIPAGLKTLDELVEYADKRKLKEANARYADIQV